MPWQVRRRQYCRIRMTKPFVRIWNVRVLIFTAVYFFCRHMYRGSVMRAELDGGEIWIESSYAENKLVSQVPGMRYHKGRDMWHVKATWTACLTMRAVYGNRLQLGPKLIEWGREQASRENALLALGNSMSGIEGALDERLFGYQRAGVEFLGNAKRAILADEPGLGKTASTISTLKLLHEAGEDVFPVLVIAPNSTKKVWEREFKNWWPDFDGTVAVVGGNATARRKALDSPASVYVIHWESVRLHSSIAGYGSIRLKACAKCGGIEDPRPDEAYKAAVPEAKCEVHPRELNLKKFRTVIVDEAHRGKDQNAKQTRAVWSVMKDAEFRFLLTGTPVTNSVDDMWSLLHSIDPEAFPVRSKFLDVFAETRLNFFGGFEVLGLNPERAETFRRILGSYMRRTPKKLALPQLPEMLPMQYREVKLKPQQAKQYEQMRKGMLTLLDNGIPLTADSAVSQFSRLKQFASATGSYNEETGKVKLTEPSSKIDDLVELLDDEGRPLVVAAPSRQLLELAGARLEKEKYKVGYITGAQTIDERDVAVREFQAGKLDVVLVNAAGAEGITLTYADTLVFLERFDSALLNEQMVNRVYRIGSEQHKAIRVICIIAEGTVESNREYTLWAKEERAQEVVQDSERLRRMLQ